MLAEIPRITRWCVALCGLVVGSISGQAAQDSIVQLATPTGTVVGSLLVPPRAVPVPVVLIVAGSGPTDRDGNSPQLPGKNNSLKLLADALYDAGIATLRYDKRGVAASAAAGPTEADLRFDTYVEDATRWIAQLRRDGRFGSITVVGHSEGSLIGILAAHTAAADGYVSLAGAGRNAADLLRDQLRPQLPPALFAATDSVLRGLENSQLQATLPAAVAGIPGLASLFRSSVQSYLISWFRYSPTVEMARLTIPVLVVQGSTDIQVGVSDARLLAAAKPDAVLEIIDGMNHVLKAVPPDRGRQVASYSDSTLALVPRLAIVVSAFVLGVPRR
jgi:uncharacterized protein